MNVFHTEATTVPLSVSESAEWTGRGVGCPHTPVSPLKSDSPLPL